MPAYGSVIDDVSSSDAGGPNEGAADAAGSKNFLERNYTTLVALLGCVALLGLNVQPRSPGAPWILPLTLLVARALASPSQISFE